MTNTQRAENALKIFHNRMWENYPAGYQKTFDELKEYINRLNPWFMNTFGGALNSATSLSAGDIQGVMEHVADLSKGALPTEARQLIVFYDALLSKYDLKEISTWLRIGKETAIATGEDIKTAAAVGLGAAAVYGLVAVVVFVMVSQRGK